MTSYLMSAVQKTVDLFNKEENLYFKGIHTSTGDIKHTLYA